LEVKLDEARFYFPEHIQRPLKDIFSASTAKMVHLVERGEVSIDDPEKSAAKAKELNDDDQKLALFYAKLPENFESVLAFKQLSAAPKRKSGCADDPACPMSLDKHIADKIEKVGQGNQAPGHQGAVIRIIFVTWRASPGHFRDTA
jgi:hypothetical protein